MTILITSDLQFDDRPLNRHRHEFMAWLTKLAAEHRVSHVYMLGDLTEDKDHHSAWLVNQIVDAVERLSQVCHVVFLRGNHDYLGDPGCPFFGFLKHIGNVTWINRPTPATAGLKNELFLPHTRNHERDWADIDFKKYDWVFAHNIFAGASTDSGHKLSGIPTSIFAKRNIVISGDVHTPQQVGPVTYVGSPYLCDFGDDYAPRLMLVDTSGGIKSIPCPGPFKRLVESNSLETLKKMRFNRGDILKIRLRVAPGDLASWPTTQQKARSWAADMGYVVWGVTPSRKPEDRSTAILRPRKKLTDGQILTNYVQARVIPEDMAKTGHWLLERA